MYAPHTNHDIEQMLATIGAGSLDELLRVPEAIALKEALDVVPALPEYLIRRRFDQFAQANSGLTYRSFLGGGAYRHYVPRGGCRACHARRVPHGVHALSSRGFARVSASDLRVADVYRAAHGNGSRERVGLRWRNGARRSGDHGARRDGAPQGLVSRAIHPNYRAVLKTYCDGLDVAVDEIPFTGEGTTDGDVLARAVAGGEYAAVALQSPNFFGNVDTPGNPAAQAMRASGTVPIAVVAEALSLAALATPASWGAQIVAGEAQSFGVALAYGGPYAGFIASTQEHLRRIPGRLVGKSVDNAGRTAYVLTLQAREQHIRRERATSNICTNQAHCALIATIYLALLGKTGLRDAAALNLARSRELASAVANVRGVRLKHAAPFFNEFVADVGRPAGEVLAALRERQILGGLDLGRFYPELSSCILMTATELTTTGDIAALANALEEVLHVPAAV